VDGNNMGRFHGFRACVTCNIPCTPLNFVDLERKRYCLACFTEMSNPEHPELEEIRKKCEDAVSEWKCIKWNRSEYKLPSGPLPARGHK